MRNLLAISVATLNIAACWAVQFVSPPPDHRPFERIFSARSQDHSSQDNTIVIQSKVYNITDGNVSTTTGTAPFRRTIHVQKEENSEENFTEPKLPQYAIDCGNDKGCLEAHGMDSPEATFKPYTQEELEKLLSQYAASQGKSPHTEEESPANKLANLYMDDEDAVINVLESNTNSKDQEKSKSASWHLLQSQKHSHPYEDEKGWVTLEPVPWAHSQIQKWEPNVKPQIPTWDSPSPHRPSDPWGYRPSTERPWGKPTYEYKPSRPQFSQWTRPSDEPPTSSHWNQDIITDNQPGYFPGPQPAHSQRPWYDQEPYGSNRPPQTYKDRPVHQNGGYHGYPSSHPKDGEGQWVLLSSTKGYSIPHRHRGAFQRALSFGAKASSSAPKVEASLSSHRTVRLTVLPADNSTNTTLSHGGLLEVESTLQTVDQAQREHAAKMLRLKNLKPVDVVQSPSTIKSNSRRSGEGVQVFSASPVDGQGKTAMLAAIGAGMIPATMAMLLPMVLGRRRRSTDNDEQHVNSTHLETVLKLQRLGGAFLQGRSNNKEASY